MLEEHVAYYLEKYLGNYVKGLSKEALKISVWQGTGFPHSLSPPLLSSPFTQHPKRQFSFFLHPTQSFLLSSFLFSRCGFLLSLRFSKIPQHPLHPITHTHRSSLIPLCSRDTCPPDLDLFWIWIWSLTLCS